MPIITPCSPNRPDYMNSCSGYFSNYTVFDRIGYINQTDIDTVGVNHPDYEKNSRCWKVMRDSVEGQDAVRENAIEMDYLHIPPGIRGGGMHTHGMDCDKSAEYHYINKAHYIEVVPRILDEVEGRIFTKKYKLEVPERLKEMLDTLDSDGLTFEEYARWCVREVFSVSRFGVLVDWDEEVQQPVLKRYVAESIVNWKLDKRGNLILVVLEDEVESSANSVFSHDMIKRRISFSLEGESGERYVVQRTWTSEQDGVDGYPSFEETGTPVVLERRGFAVSTIPFIFFGGVKPTAPMLKPLAAAALDYFDAHASYRNALWWASTEQPYFNFDEDGGFMFGPKDDDDENRDDTFILTWGSSTPIALKKGELKFAHVSGIGLTAARQRLTDIKAEMTGMGARSFNAQTASNIKVQTERMQQRAEGSVIGSIAAAISRGIETALELASEWAEISSSEIVIFELNQDFTDDFEFKDIPSIIAAIESNIIPEEYVWDYLRKNSKLIPPHATDEEIRAKIKSQEFGGGFNTFDDFEDLNDEDLATKDLDDQDDTI